MNNKVIINLKIILRRTIYLTLGLTDRVRSRKNPIFILCYHAISKDNWRFSVDYETFVKHISYLAKNYIPLSLDDLESYIEGRITLSKPAFIITIDDGYRDVLKVRGLFKKFRIKPTIFVLSDTKRASREELDTDREFLTKADILDLKKDGWIIGSHGAMHSDFNHLSDEQIDDEVIGSKQRLEKELDTKIAYFAYPKGRYTKKILSAVSKAGYSLGLTMDDGFIDRKTNPLIVPRVGVNRTHTFAEFKSIYVPSVVIFRKIIKENIGIPI